jgi:hypothetical protein
MYAAPALTAPPIDHDDRRTFARRRAEGVAHASVGKRGEPVSLELSDVSAGGIGAWTNRALSRGQSIELAFPPNGTKIGFVARGRVVRCEPSAFGYRVGVQFDRPLGA